MRKRDIRIEVRLFRGVRHGDETNDKTLGKYIGRESTYGDVNRVMSLANPLLRTCGRDRDRTLLVDYGTGKTYRSQREC